VRAFIAALPKARQTVFFSATFPPGIKELSQRYQTNAKTIQITEGPSQSLQIQQYLYGAEKPQKLEVLQQILKLHPAKCTLIFCRTKQLVREIGEQLTLAKISTHVLHADLKQNERDQVMKLFRSGGQPPTKPNSLRRSRPQPASA
jgi:superfamily II DNA/RNA helicase